VGFMLVGDIGQGRDAEGLKAPDSRMENGQLFHQGDAESPALNTRIAACSADKAG
jgi:hypothetical protein